jgi:hypothetical protein
MKPTNRADEEARREVFKGLLRKAKLDFDEYSLMVVWAGENSKHASGYLTVQFTGDTLSFETLAEISRFLGTRKIDLDCDTGCGSDPCHDRTITIYGALGL